MTFNIVLSAPSLALRYYTLFFVMLEKQFVAVVDCQMTFINLMGVTRITPMITEQQLYVYNNSKITILLHQQNCTLSLSSSLCLTRKICCNVIIQLLDDIFFAFLFIYLFF